MAFPNSKIEEIVRKNTEMDMNRNFEWSRFCKVVRKDFGNIWQQAGTTLLMLTLIPLGVWLVRMALTVGYGTIVPEARWSVIGMMVVLASGLTPSRLYRTCNLPKEGIYFAMLPASKLEKYLSMLLFSILVCPLMCLVGSIALDYLLTLLPFGPYEKWLWQTDDLAELLDEYRRIVASSPTDGAGEQVCLFTKVLTPGWVVLSMVLSYLYNAAIFIFTNIIFKKHKVLQTVLWIWLISFVVSLVSAPMMFRFGFEFDPSAAEFVHSVEVFFVSTMALSAVMTGVLLCWGWHKLKRMSY